MTQGVQVIIIIMFYIFDMNLLFKITILLTILCISFHRCINNTFFKYELSQPSEIVNYNEMCYEFSTRTCCSTNNLDLLTKKIVKVIGSTYEFSHRCRRYLTHLMCSSCDGDIGENIHEGVCPSYCGQVFDACKNDYFNIDSNNFMRACREEDIICSSLEDIIAKRPKTQVCDLFQLKISSVACWNGQISGHIRGKAKKKVQFIPKRKPQKKDASYEQWMNSTILIYILIVIVLASVLVYYCINSRKSSGVRIGSSKGHLKKL